MAKVIGIDPGTVSFDVCGLEDGRVFLDTSLASPDFAADPQTLIDLIQSVRPVDLIVAPSGYGLPIVPIEAFGNRERFLFTLVDERERNKIPVLGGMGKMIPLMKSSGLPFLFIPGVIHLPTVPEYRKANKIDMGTADKLCCLALGIFDQARCYNLPFEETSFIFVEMGGAYTAVMAVSAGKVVDGLGGSVGGPGFYAMGSMDGELAYLLGSFPKEVLFSGGAADIAGQAGLSPEAFADLAKEDERVHNAWEALLEGVCKSVASELVVIPEPREILLSGRLCRTETIRQELKRRLQSYAPVRSIERLAKITKEAAQGAALIADGLMGGRYRTLVDVMELRGAKGTALDHLYIKDQAALCQKYLG